MHHMSFCFWLILFGAFLSSSRATKNVLFISVDDLRPELEPYAGKSDSSPLFPNIHTPNIEALAKRSIVFHNSYVQQPLCAPSRASLLTGRRPDTTRVHGFHKNFRQVGGNFTTIPQFFKNEGYQTIGFGKIFHNGEDWNDDPLSWSEPFLRAKNNFESKCCSWHAIPDANLTETKTLEDIQVADMAIDKLRSLAQDALSGTKPFFLAAGFYKPHLPYVFPESFLQYYPEDTIYLPSNIYAPRNMPKIAWSDYVYLLKHDDIKKLKITGKFNTTLPTTKSLELRRTYYSAVTYVDSQIGRVLDELEHLGLADNTVIAFWSDHGYHLGENGEWCKHTAFELSAWAPLMFSIPGITDTGIETSELVEHIDIFPTLVEATGYKVPELCPFVSNHIKLCVEGISLMPLVNSPKDPIKSASFTQAVRSNKTMGYSMRTKQYRYIEWVEFVPGKGKPSWNVVKARELYDHIKDPSENYNVVEEKEYESAVHDLQRMLRQGWRKAIIARDGNDGDKTTTLQETTVNDESNQLIDEIISDEVSLKESQNHKPQNKKSKHTTVLPFQILKDNEVLHQVETTSRITTEDKSNVHDQILSDHIENGRDNKDKINNQSVHSDYNDSRYAASGQTGAKAAQAEDDESSKTNNVEKKQFSDSSHGVNETVSQSANDHHENSVELEEVKSNQSAESLGIEPNDKRVNDAIAQSPVKDIDAIVDSELPGHDNFESSRIDAVYEQKDETCCSVVQIVLISVVVSFSSVMIALLVQFYIKKLLHSRTSHFGSYFGYKYEKLSVGEDQDS